VSVTEPFDTTTPMGRAMLGMIAVWSQLEADMVSERTRHALQLVKDRGGKLGAPTMNETVPATVRKVHQLRAQGLTIRQIADQMNADGIPGSRGGRWWVKTVRAALAQGKTAIPLEEVPS
jgi:site-specific DNA recombinase